MVTAAIGAVALCGALSACGTEEVGSHDVADSPSGAFAGTSFSVVVPIGTVDVEVGRPTDRIGDLVPPDGGSLVRISTSFDRAEVRSDVWRFAGRAGAAKPIGLELLVGEATYDLGTVAGGEDDAPRDLVVGLDEGAEDAADLEVGVGYDGLVQTVDLDGNRAPGPADALYSDPGTEPVPTSCSDVRLDHGVAADAATCRIDRADHLPYLPRLGWAEEGRTWLAMGLAVALDPVDLGNAEPPVAYALGSVEDRSRLSGEPAERVVDATDEIVASGWSGTVVFDSPVDVPPRVAVRLRLGLTPADGNLHRRAPDALELSARAPTSLDPAAG